MRVVLKHELNRVKNGYAARSPELGLTANGHSPEVARRNLERLVVLYLRPFERQGDLEREVADAHLQSEDAGPELTVVTVG